MTKGIEWSVAMIEFMKTKSKKLTRQEMAEELTKNFGLRVTFTMVKNAYRRNGITGMDTRIKRGSIPPNKGKKGVSHPGSYATQFTKGHRPKNWLPIGTERINSDGFHQVKMTDTGYPPKDWVMKSVLEWEKVNGKIPNNHILRFRDGDRSNCSPKNLLLVSRQENAVINRWLKTNDLPEGGLEAVHLMAKIKIASKVRMKKIGGKRHA